MKLRVLHMVLVVFLSCAVVAQEYQIKGKVVNQRTHQPIEYAHVLVEELATGASTDSTGRFTISKIPPGFYRLRVSSLGYKTFFTAEYRVNHVTPFLTIELEEESASIGEVTITASPFERIPESPVSLHVIQLQEIEKAPGAIETYPGWYRTIQGWLSRRLDIGMTLL